MLRLQLAKRREEAGLSQLAIAVEADISQGYYSEIESGIRTPSPRVAERISETLAIDEKDIYAIFYKYHGK